MLGQQLGMNFIHAQLTSHRFAYGFGVTGQHDGFANAQLLQGTDRFSRIVLHFIRNHQMSGILPLFGNMHNGADGLGFLIRNARLLH
ncbi:hypothetical protein D1872_251080 [compost metagenome]